MKKNTSLGSAYHYGQSKNRKEDEENTEIRPHNNQDIKQELYELNDILEADGKEDEEEFLAPGELIDEETVDESKADNDGGIYKKNETFDEDSQGLESGSPGHPGIDEGTD